jgi:hypothetical protein
LLKGERVPLSGQSRYRGNGSDIDLYPWGSDGPPLCCEVKARASGAGFTTLERWLADADVLFLRRDRGEPLVVLPWATWARLVPGMARAVRRGGRRIAVSPGAPLPAKGAPAAPAGDTETDRLRALEQLAERIAEIGAVAAGLLAGRNRSAPIELECDSNG